ncbi:hypothetical protein QUH73_13850 [Labilibaculum sp. K2S]|uniref:hypothetical protein n=1 Tax=Labilibaculum sp. K2S TaxID=3056386 RepID=UPI0025A4A20B|nr:hypothetical protein [Labilibaculum sp. K2S]MDM8160903.1 hypothetical protein [Labilibaculum sp. K2S]
MDDTLLNILQRVLFIIPEIIILIACILNLTYKQSTAGIFLIVGAGIRFLGSLFQSIAIPYLIQVGNTDLLSGSVNIFTFTTPLFFIGSVLFAIGLLLMVQEKARMHKTI